MDAILYVSRSGCSWRRLPRDVPPWETVYWYFKRWCDDGTVTRVHDALREQVRLAEGRDAEPSAGIIDSRSVKGAETVPSHTRGYDAGKRINGRKRFIVTDTLGLILTALVMSAGVQDRQGGRRALLDLRLKHPGVRHVWADGGFSGQLVTWAQKILTRTVEIVRKKDGQRGFEVLPRRWVVERTNGWLMQHRRLARDYERDPTTAEAMIRWAMINVISRRLTRQGPITPPTKRPLRYTPS